MDAKPRELYLLFRAYKVSQSCLWYESLFSHKQKSGNTRIFNLNLHGNPGTCVGNFTEKRVKVLDDKHAFPFGWRGNKTEDATEKQKKRCNEDDEFKRKSLFDMFLLLTLLYLLLEYFFNPMVMWDKKEKKRILEKCWKNWTGNAFEPVKDCRVFHSQVEEKTKREDDSEKRKGFKLWEKR